MRHPATVKPSLFNPLTVSFPAIDAQHSVQLVFLFPPFSIFFQRNDKNVTTSARRDARKITMRATVGRLRALRRLRHAIRCLLSHRNCRRPPIRIKRETSNDSRLFICDPPRAENSVNFHSRPFVAIAASARSAVAKTCRLFHDSKETRDNFHMSLSKLFPAISRTSEQIRARNCESDPTKIYQSAELNQ